MLIFGEIFYKCYKHSLYIYGFDDVERVRLLLHYSRVLLKLYLFAIEIDNISFLKIFFV